MPDLTNEFVEKNHLDMRTEIRRERTVELFDEGFRMDDLKRWYTAEKEMKMDLVGVNIQEQSLSANGRQCPIRPMMKDAWSWNLVEFGKTSIICIRYLQTSCS